MQPILPPPCCSVSIYNVILIHLYGKWDWNNCVRHQPPCLRHQYWKPRNSKEIDSWPQRPCKNVRICNLCSWQDHLRRCCLRLLLLPQLCHLPRRPCFLITCWVVVVVLEEEAVVVVVVIPRLWRVGALQTIFLMRSLCKISNINCYGSDWTCRLPPPPRMLHIWELAGQALLVVQLLLVRRNTIISKLHPPSPFWPNKVCSIDNKYWKT